MEMNRIWFSNCRGVKKSGGCVRTWSAQTVLVIVIIDYWLYFFWFQLLQNLGKVDRTADEIFDEHLQNFTRQQNAANRLQKEFSNYIRCIRGM